MARRRRPKRSSKKAAQGEKILVNVLIADDHLKRFKEIAKKANDAGLNIQQRLETAGVVSGEIESGKIEGLRRVQGVASVEVSRNVRALG